MTTYEKSFKEEAVKLSDEIGIKKAAQQLGIPYYTLADWRHRQNIHGSQAHVGNDYALARVLLNPLGKLSDTNP